MTQTPPSHIEQEARRLYRQAVAEVDTATAARLREARQTALEAGATRHPLRWMVPTGALAASLMALALVWRPTHHTAGTPQVPTVQTAGTSADADLPPDPDSTDPALVEDMGFYAWLADQPAQGNGRH